MYILVWLVLGFIYARRFVPLVKKVRKRIIRDTQTPPDLESVLAAVKEHNSLPKDLQETVNATLLKSYSDMPLIFPDGATRTPSERRSQAVRNYVEKLAVGAYHPKLRPLLTDVITHLSDPKREASSFASKLILFYDLPGFNHTGDDQGFVDDNDIDFSDNFDLDCGLEDNGKGGDTNGEMLKGWANLEWIAWFLKQQHRQYEILEALRSATSKKSEGVQEYSEWDDTSVFLIHQVKNYI